MAAKRKPTRVAKRRQTAALASAPTELREETQVRRLRAKLEKETLKQGLAALATYKAADRGRENRDWRASAASADAAYIPDSLTIMSRCRQAVRDSWQGRAIVKAFTRNVVQNGILPVPQPRTNDGTVDGELAKQMLGLFLQWASDPACDVAGEQTFWQMQSLAEAERCTVGEAYFIWSYVPPIYDGALDLRHPVGLRLQQFESEQLDPNLTAHGGNEVRGGVEVDGFGRAVAYHIFERNPNDYLLPASKSVRVPAERVVRYKRKERVGQSRGVSDMAAVLQDIRNCWRVNNAMMWRMIMESCIGLLITQNSPSGGSSGFGTFPRASGDTGTTGSGMSTVDIVPGMVARLGPNESVTSHVPQSPGNQYEPFMRMQSRGIAAGAGVGFGQLTMDFTQGTYSGQRQEMLETRREFEPLQELLAHSLLIPIWRLFVQFAVYEGRLSIPDFAADPRRYTECDYVAPPMPWIDPEKEISAAAMAIEQKVMDRGELALMRGVRLEDVWDRIEQQQQEADRRGIVLPETQEAAPAPAPEPQPEQPEQPAKPAALAQIDAPNYRSAGPDAAQRCATCQYFQDGKCAAYAFAATPVSVCDGWEAEAVGKDNGTITRTPPVPDGQRPIDDVRSEFNDRGARGVS